MDYIFKICKGNEYVELMRTVVKINAFYAKWVGLETS